MKILLLDDDECLLNVLAFILTKLGHTVDRANDAQEAAKIIETGGYDFALVDYTMPVHDGIWFMKHAHIPKTTKVLLMTGHVDRKNITMMFKLGARGYLIKPLDKEELEQHIAFHSNLVGAAQEN